jgi:amino acid transporter
MTLFAISCIVGTRWIAAAAHGGPGSITLWALSAVFFCVPLAIACGTLAAKHPNSGGLYLWAKHDFGPWHGFLAFWVYWLAIAIWFPGAAMFYMSAGLHALGLPDDGPLVLAAALLAIWIPLGTNIVGVNVGKWTQNAGGAAAWALSALFVAAAGLVWMKRGSATPMHIAPVWNWDTVNFWSTIAFAMTGLELSGIIAGEVKDPTRTLPRAGWMASGCATAFYISATVALLVLLPPGKISTMNGLAEAGDEAAQSLGVPALGVAVAILVVLSGMGQLGGLGSATARLPFAAGVDGLLPEVFARVHPRWRTPHQSILILGAVATVLLLAMQVGDTMRAAYDALVSLTVIAGLLPLLYIFASSWVAGNRISAASGWAVTAIAILCAVIPTAETHNVWLFECKLAAGTIGVIGSAWLVYRRRARI